MLKEECELNNDNSILESITVKKRGRKPKNISNNINDLLIKTKKCNSKIINLNTNINYETISNMVAHLPLRNNDINKILNNKIVDEPNDNYFNITIDNNTTSSNVNVNNKCLNCIKYKQNINDLSEEIKIMKNNLYHEIDKDVNNSIYQSRVLFHNINNLKWAESTDIACWWCCHQFDNTPIGIPEYKIKNKFYLYGCFCSFNCMLSYNIDINDSKIWDRQTNIYILKNIIDKDNNYIINPAPPRQCLKFFGGNLSILEYRKSFFILNKEYRYLLPPMMSIISSIEEYNKDIKKKYEKNDNFVIKRTKPLVTISNSLKVL